MLSVRFSLAILLLAVLSLIDLQTRSVSAQTETVLLDDSGKDVEDPGLLTNTRQFTFAGKRSGEGYFNSAGNLFVFQSERESGNPFFQIYLLDLETGDEERISPGSGKTTCAWIHPDNRQVLFASTHLDREAEQKQADELADRADGTEKRYSWDYDSHYDLFAYDRQTKQSVQLTSEPGYDAEGSYSPDGQLIAFASNREAYQRELTKAEQELLERDPSVFMDIYIMQADGTNVRRQTEILGYDGGPFFSPDGKRICWRRFAEHGATAEIMTMNIDGSDVQQLTSLQVMSWAPYYHPSGEYLIFTTNRHGFANFELYLVAADGSGSPQRVTVAEGFDGLPVFSPDGTTLVWTSNRTANKQSQLFRADWNHELALDLLDIEVGSSQQAENSAREAARLTTDDFEPADIARHVNYLCSEDLAGRLTGTVGEQLATQYVATYFEELGLQPGGNNSGWFQEFEFTAGIDLGDNNTCQSQERTWELNQDWRPIAFSANGDFSGTEIAFAGYGLVAAAVKDHAEYDSYVHLDVKDKWVVVFRYLPENIAPELRQQWARFGSLRYKAMVARDRGAKGLIVVSGPRSRVKQQLVPLSYDGSLAGTSIPVITVTDQVVADWLKPSGQTLNDYQKSLDTGEPRMGFVVENQSLQVSVDIEQVKRKGRNVLGVLQADAGQQAPALLVGAHIDHLGRGGSSSSLANEDEQQQIHFGADDNASGTAALLEIAEYLSQQQRSGQLKLKRDIIFAAWSGEELGLYGSTHYVNDLQKQLQEFASAHMAAVSAAEPEKEQSKPATDPSAPKKSAEATEAEDEQIPLSFVLAACLNMDMVGRMTDSLVLQGVGSSTIWEREVEKRNLLVGLPITLQNDSYIPTDASIFFMNGVPILSAFTGTHSDYHTPRDTPDKLNYAAAAKISRLMGLIARGLAAGTATPDYVHQERPEEQRRANLRAYLGTIPDYAAGDAPGVKLAGVGKGGPAEQAGLQKGDVIVELAGKKIENIYDYTYAIEALKIGEQVTIKINRQDKTIELKLTPGSRD